LVPEVSRQSCGLVKSRTAEAGKFRPCKMRPPYYLGMWVTITQYRDVTCQKNGIVSHAPGWKLQTLDRFYCSQCLLTFSASMCLGHTHERDALPWQLWK
jgi:hypothetical protein